jgi:VanZ family protein
MSDFAKNRPGDTIRFRIAVVVCLFLLGGILCAGLWPFHAPSNGATWIEHKNGLEFQRYTTLASAQPFPARDAANNPGGTLEIWLSSGLRRQGTILVFADPEHSEFTFALRQMGSNLALERYQVDAHGVASHLWLTAENVFDDQPVFVTITGGKDGTRVYKDGVLAATSSYFGMESSDLSGRLILGTSLRNDSWTGTMFALVVSSRKLNEQEIKNDVSVWKSPAGQLLASVPGSDGAVYRFDERGGNVVRNVANPATNLLIPSHYQVLESPFLQAPWEQYRHPWSAAHQLSYWMDVAVNVAGFVPVGFCFAGLFCMVADERHSFWAVAFSGFLLSFTIESLQWFLPTRNSGLTDVITNTLGTCLGYVLYRSSMGQVLWTRSLDLTARVAQYVITTSTTVGDSKASLAA